MTPVKSITSVPPPICLPPTFASPSAASAASSEAGASCDSFGADACGDRLI